MYKSYYFLNRLIIELNKILSGKKIRSIFSQDKDRLIIQLDGIEELYVEISVNHSDPYITIKERFSRAKKNTVEFFNILFYKTIKEVLIASDDRIIKIVTDSGDLIFTIRGKYTNVFFNTDTLTSFKYELEENLKRFKDEFGEKYFHNSFNIPDNDFIDGKKIEEIRQKYQFIGREIENEIKARRILPETDSNILLNVLQDIFTEDTAVYTREKNGEIFIGFDSFKIFSMYDKQLFESIIKALNFFLSKRNQYEEINNKLKKISLFIDGELKKKSARLNNLLMVLEKGSQEEHFNKIANLLLINLNKIDSGLSEIQVDDLYETNSKLIINLDTKLSPEKNIEKYFKKSRDSRINFEKSTKLYSSTQKEFESLKLYQQKLEKILTIEEIEQIMNELKLPNTKKAQLSEEIGSKFKHYIVDKKYHIFVGKDSLNNDMLTTKFAKQNDYWFHARSVSGSHVILKVENIKEVIPKIVLKKAASLAAYHSKAKSAGIVPVSFTLKKYVIKRKGQPTGQVSLLKEEILLVKPEIPSDTEYLTV